MKRRTGKNDHIERATRFFRLGLSHDSLTNHYQTNFSMMQHHKYSLTELDNMLPWERQIYVALLIEYIKEENDKMERANKGIR